LANLFPEAIKKVTENATAIAMDSIIGRIVLRGWAIIVVLTVSSTVAVRVSMTGLVTHAVTVLVYSLKYLHCLVSVVIFLMIYVVVSSRMRV
jgi:hypothetical protein